MNRVHRDKPWHCIAMTWARMSPKVSSLFELDSGDWLSDAAERYLSDQNLPEHRDSYVLVMMSILSD